MFEGSLRLLWQILNFGGNWFGLSLWKKEYPIMLNTLQEMGFYLKGLDFDVWMLNWWKWKQKFCRLLAAPSEYTSGTHMRVPPGPLGKFWNSQKLYWRNQILGSAWSASAAKVYSPRFWPAKRFSNFLKTLGNENLLYDRLGNAKIGHIDIHLLGLWPGANDFHLT